MLQLAHKDAFACLVYIPEIPLGERRDAAVRHYRRISHASANGIGRPTTATGEGLLHGFIIAASNPRQESDPRVIDVTEGVALR